MFVLIRVLRLWFPGRHDARSGPCYGPLKHGFFIEGFPFLDGLLGLLVAMVAVVPGRHPSFVLLLQFVPQCEEGGVEFDAAIEQSVQEGEPLNEEPMFQGAITRSRARIIAARKPQTQNTD